MTRLIGNARLMCDPDLLICTACGTQYAVKEGEQKDECRVCDDPRQFVPPEGQSFTTLSHLRQTHHNEWWQDKHDPRILMVKTEPSFAIGNRAELIQTPYGNILMDLIPLLDEDTVTRINNLGGLTAIVISHPHYYSTWAEWSRTFSCPVYAGVQDKEWFNRTNTPGTDIRFLTNTYTKIPINSHDAGLTAMVVGGHFPGSLVLHWENYLFIADTIWTSPSAMNPVPGKPGVISFTFFWSIPNRIPMHPNDILKIWRLIKQSGLEFETCFGAFKDQDTYTQANEEERGTGGVKGRLLESCKTYARAMGWERHELLQETL